MGFATVKRACEILKVLSIRLVFHRLTRHRNKSLGRRLREACEELGTTFIKFGQLLSTRREILSDDDCEELQKLLDNVPTFPYELVQEMFEHDFGKTPDRLFRKFDPEPIASASVSQVYKAVTHDGKNVAVKVRRPWIGKPVEEDMRILGSVVRLAQLFSPTLRHIGGARVVNELRSWMMQEIDFLREAENIKEFMAIGGKYVGKRIEKGHGRLYFPFLYPKLCSPNVITMDFLEGIPLNRYDRALDAQGYDPFLSIKSCARCNLRQMFIDDEYVFSGDPHPANWMIMKNGDFGIVDLGLVGRMNRRMTVSARELFLAVYVNDLDATIASFLRLCNAPHDPFADRIRQDVKSYLERAPHEGVGYWLMEFARIGVKHRVPVPVEIVLFARMNILIDGILHAIDPTKTTLDLLGDELERCLKRSIVKNFREVNYAPALYALSLKARENPQLFASLIKKYADDPLRFFSDIKSKVGA